jgi:hypothetical protein
MTKMHNRKFAIGLAADFNERTRHTINAADKVRNEFENLIIRHNVLKNTPFSWISLVICFVKEERREIVIKRISKKYGDISISAYWNYEEIKAVDDCRV